MSAAPQGNLLLEIHLRESALERERYERERADRNASNTAAGHQREQTDYSLVFVRPSRRMVKPPLNRAEAEAEVRAMRARCETLAAQLVAADAALAASDAARNTGPEVDHRLTAAIAEAQQRLDAARTPHIVRGYDHRAVYEAESALAEAHRVADLARAQRASASPTVSRTELFRHRSDCDRLLTYWTGQARKLERRLAREAAQAEADRAHLERLSAMHGGRSAVQRGLDRARAIVAGAS